MSEKKKRRKATKKKRTHFPGKVLRVDDDTWSFIQGEIRSGEKISHAVKRLLGSGESLRYALPSDLHETPEDARGQAVLKALREGKGKKQREEPTLVRKVNS